jgi:hypothetical protein
MRSGTYANHNDYPTSLVYDETTTTHPYRSEGVPKGLTHHASESAWLHRAKDGFCVNIRISRRCASFSQVDDRSQNGAVPPTLFCVAVDADSVR